MNKLLQIRIHNLNNTDRYASQIWEYYYSYRQSICYPNKPPIEIIYEDIEGFSDNNTNVLHVGIDDFEDFDVEYINKYDLILFDNTIEHLCMGNDTALKIIKNNINVYFVVGSFVHPEYHLFEKCITMPDDWMSCRNWYTNPKVFLSYGVLANNKKNNKMIYIGGELRSYRKYIIDLVQEIGIPILQNSDEITFTTDGGNGTLYDRGFAEECNTDYNIFKGAAVNKFYERIQFGLPQRITGEATISYFILPEYQTHSCIVYAESCFINDTIFLTEKTFKCIVSKTHFVIFAGKNTYKLLNDYGLRSILELVPNGLAFDCIENHKERFKEQIKSLAYLQQHPEIFNSDAAVEILNSNYEEFFSGNKFMEPTLNKFNTILRILHND